MEYSAEETIRLKNLFLQCAAKVCPTFRLTEDMKPLVSDIFAWCVRHKDSRFDTGKGLWIYGDIGSGKSTMLKIIQAFGSVKVPFYHFRITSAIDVAGEFNKNGYDALDPYVTTRFQAFDDLGSEPLKVNYYGTMVNPMEYVLTGRYDRREGDYTYVTTNYTSERVCEAYGERVYDRCRQMFNFVQMRGASWR